MRIRLATALVLLALPGLAEAQRRFPWFGRGRGDGREMPPVPGQISRELSYRRLRYSIESYPFITTIRAPGFTAPGALSKWTSFGLGEHLSYRISPWFAAAVDVTSAQIGGNAATETIELGARFGPERWNHRVHPFVDTRIGWLRAYDGWFGGSTFAVSTPTSMQEPKYGEGFGGVVGVGAERSVTSTLSLTTAFAYSRNRLDTRAINPGTSVRERYTLTARRYIIALRWNPVRWLAPNAAAPQGH